MNGFIKTDKGDTTIPKIIECSREDILQESKRQAIALGYSKLSIKEIAKACNIAVGTIYNYFPSKEMLVASFILEDWQKWLENTEALLENEKDEYKIPETVYRELLAFDESFKEIFYGMAIVAKPSFAFKERHVLLRSQITDLMKKHMATDEDSLKFIAESMLGWSAEGVDYTDIKKYIDLIIKGD